MENSKYGGIMDETVGDGVGNYRAPIQKDPYYAGIVDKAKRKVKKVLCPTVKKHVQTPSQQVPVMETVLQELLDEVENNNFCPSEKSYYQSFKGLLGYGGKTKKYGKRKSKTNKRNKKTRRNKRKTSRK